MRTLAFTCSQIMVGGDVPTRHRRRTLLKLLEKINAEADAPESYRSNPRYWRENQGAVEDARLLLGEEAERRGGYVAARMWYAEAMAVSDTSTLTATTKLASLLPIWGGPTIPVSPEPPARFCSRSKSP